MIPDTLDQNAVTAAADRVDWLGLARTWTDRLQAVIADRQAQFEVMVEFIRLRQPPGRPVRFLELCAGPGCQSEALLKAFPDAEATVFEYNPFFREMARRNIGRLTSRLTLVGSDLRNAEWHRGLTGGYDAVVSADALAGMPAPSLNGVYAGVRSLLRPGGTFINCDYIRSEDDGVQDLFRQVKRRRHVPDSDRAFARFWAEVERSLGVPGFGDRWLADLSEAESLGTDGRPWPQHREMLRNAGFASAWTLWQHYGDCVYGAIA